MLPRCRNVVIANLIFVINNEMWQHSVSDPNSSNPDPDPAKNLNPDPEPAKNLYPYPTSKKSQSGSGSKRSLNLDPNPMYFLTLSEQKLKLLHNYKTFSSKEVN